MNFLPIAGEHKWWDKLVSWLLVAHNPDGTIKTEILDAVVPGDIVTQQDLDLAVGGKADQAGLSALTATVATKAFQVDLDDTNDVVATKASQSDMTAAQADILTKASQAALTTTNTNVATNTTAIARTDPGSAAPTDDTYWVKSIQGTKAWGPSADLDVLDFYTSGDSGDYGPAVNRAIAKKAATRNDRGNIVLPNRAEAYRTTVNLTSNMVLRGRGSSTEVIIDTLPTGDGGRLFKGWGTLGARVALTSDTPAGSWTVALPTGAVAAAAIAGMPIQVGGLIELTSDALTYGGVYSTRDLRKVMAISTDTVTLDAPLIDALNTADNAKYAAVSPLRNIGIQDFLVSNTDPSTLTTFPVDVRVAEGVRYSDITLKNGGGGFVVYDTLFPVLDNLIVDVLPNGWLVNPAFTGNGYGVTFGGAVSGGIVSNLRSRHVRHAFTTVPLSDGSTRGGPRDCIIKNGISYQYPGAINPTSHWDTHQSGHNIVFDTCIAGGGGSAGYQVRARSVKLINCISRYAGTRGATVDASAPDCLIQGGTYSLSTQEGVAMSGANGRVVGAFVRDNLGGSSQIGVSVGADNVTVEACRVENNGVSAGTGITYVSGTNPRFINNIVPASTAQTKAISNLPAGAIVQGGTAMGYTSDATAFFGANGGAIITGVETTHRGVRSGSGTTIGAAARVERISAFGGNQTATLPTVTTAMIGREITVIKTDSSANTVTVAGTINGVTNKVISSQWGSLTVRCNGTNWDIVAQFGTVT